MTSLIYISRRQGSRNYSRLKLISMRCVNPSLVKAKESWSRQLKTASIKKSKLSKQRIKIVYWPKVRSSAWNSRMSKQQKK